MPISLEDPVKSLLAAASAVKVLVTSDLDGVPHAVVDPELSLEADGHLLHLARLESSRTHRDLVASVWFDRPVAVVVAAPGGRTFRIAGRAVKAHVAGPVLRRHLAAVRAADPDADLAAVWRIAPTAVTEETYAVARERQDRERPFLKHLDLLARS